MTDRERLLEILNVPIYPHENVDPLEAVADYLLDNDVVQVVRCKNCTSYNTKGCAKGFGWCVAWDQGRIDNNFCHCGERKNNG